MDCYCDYEPSEFYKATRPRARKSHECDECLGIIHTGERYERVFAVSNGDVDTAKTCVRCLALRDYIESIARCFCWRHGCMLEDAQEWARGVTMPGVRMAVGRFLIESQEDR